jgi:ABC-2 type transport system permease protein
MFPITVLPGWLQALALCLPLTHALEAMRQFLLAGAGIAAVSDHLLAMFLFLVVLVPATRFINTFCMRAAKKQGAFSTY